MPAQIVDTPDHLNSLLTRLDHGSSEKQLLFLALESIDPSRHASIAIMQMLLPPSPVVYLIDIHVLGRDVFTVATPQGITFQSVLESQEIPKVFFDVRQASHTLFHHYRVDLKCVVEIQLLEFYSRPHAGDFVKGITKCIIEEMIHLPYMGGEDWDFYKNPGRNLVDPTRGGTTEVLFERPLSEDLIRYCELDVIMMPGLLSLYAKRLEHAKAARVQEAVDERVRDSQKAKFHAGTRRMALGPKTGAQSAEQEVPPGSPMNIVCSTDLEESCRMDGIRSESEVVRSGFEWMLSMSEESLTSLLNSTSMRCQ